MELHVPFETLYVNLFSHLKLNTNTTEFSYDLYQTKSALEKFLYLWKSTDVQNFTKIYICRACKDDKLAEDFRKDGNNFYNNSDFQKALEYYNKSIMFSQHPGSSDRSSNSESFKNISRNLALAFANRSATLFELQNYSSTVNDIENSFKFGYPSLLKPKLIERQFRCYLAQKNYERAKEILNAYLEEFENMDENEAIVLKDSVKKINSLFTLCDSSYEIVSKSNVSKSFLKQQKVCTITISEPPPLLEYNSSIPSFSSCVSINYTKGKGRTLVANRDIIPGELLVKEKSYSAVVLPKSLATHCSFCLQRTLTPVPCPQCSCVVFCCDECAFNAKQQFHDIECDILPTLIALDMGENSFLAIRIVILLSLEGLKNKIPIYEKEKIDKLKQNLGFNDLNIYVSDDFRPIYHLVTNIEKRSVSSLFKRGVMAVCLVKLIMKSKFFGGSNLLIEDINTTDINLIGQSIFTLLMSLQCNSFSISEECINYSSYQESSLKQIGAGIFAGFSLSSHSCSPSACRSFYGSTVVARAIQFIPKGGEITTSYDHNYAMLNKEERKNELQKQYYFDCNCEACSSDWLLYPSLSGKISLKCPKCNFKIEPPKNTCPFCNTNFSNTYYEGKSLKQIYGEMRIANDVIHRLYKNDHSCREELFEKNEQYFKDAVHLLSLYSVLPNRAFYEAQEILKYFYDREGSHYYC